MLLVVAIAVWLIKIYFIHNLIVHNGNELLVYILYVVYFHDILITARIIIYKAIENFSKMVITFVERRGYVPDDAWQYPWVGILNQSMTHSIRVYCRYLLYLKDGLSAVLDIQTSL